MLAVSQSSNCMFIEEQNQWRLSLQQGEEMKMHATVELSKNQKEQRDPRSCLENVKQDFPSANSVFIKDWLREGRSVWWIKSTLQSQDQIFEKKKISQRKPKNDGSQVDHVSKYIIFERIGSNSALPPPPPPVRTYLRSASSILTDDGSTSCCTSTRMLQANDPASQVSTVERDTTRKGTSKTSNNRLANNPRDAPFLKAPPTRRGLKELSRRDQTIAQFKPSSPSLSNLKAAPRSNEQISNTEKANKKCALENNEMGIILCLFPKANPRRVLNLLSDGRSLREIIIMLGREE